MQAAWPPFARLLRSVQFRIGSVHSRLHGSVTLTCMHTVQGDAMHTLTLHGSGSTVQHSAAHCSTPQPPHANSRYCRGVRSIVAGQGSSSSWPVMSQAVSQPASQQ